MAGEETILQSELFTRFALPFLLIFFIVFGILEKTKLFGENKQLNALISFVIGLIFVSVVYPTLVVSNLILFLTVALVVMFVALLLWGFVAGDKGLKFEDAPTELKWFIGVVIGLAVLIALLWALGIEQGVFGWLSTNLFKQTWSGNFWTNVAFIAMIIIALVIVLKGGKSE